MLNDELADTWELDGDTWTQRSSGVDPGPGPRREPAMAFDPVSQTMLVYGGRAGASNIPTTFAWDGTTWSHVATESNDTGRGRLVTHVHDKRVLLIAYDGMFAWSGAGWTKLFTSVQGGMRRGRVAAASDVAGRRVLVFGGSAGQLLSDSTEIWRGTWAQHVGVSPSRRAYSAMAYDAARREFVLFGGTDGDENLNDTWVFANNTWIQRTPSSSPPKRYGHSMVYDVKRGVVVMFGGTGANWYGDTWSWDGTTWSQAVGAGPAARDGHASTYDPIREETIVFGGYAGFDRPVLGDTWVWNGAWTKRTDIGPSPRFATGSAWDYARQRVVLFGGSNGAATFSDAWEWDGLAWKLVAATAIAPRAGHVVVSAIDGAGVLRFGMDNQLDRDDLAQLRWSSRTREEACVVGVDSDGDRFTTLACGGGDPDCWRVCAPLCPPGTSCTTTGCGDGVCAGGAETCLSCPQDCNACASTCGDLVCSADETAASCAADCP